MAINLQGTWKNVANSNGDVDRGIYEILQVGDVAWGYGKGQGDDKFENFGRGVIVDDKKVVIDWSDTRNGNASEQKFHAEDLDIISPNKIVNQNTKTTYGNWER